MSAAIHESMIDLVNEIEAAKILCVSKHTLRQWRLTSRGPRFYKLGTGKRAPVRYSRPDLAAFVASSIRGGKVA